MPARDGTGPDGQGPLTGRGAGPCAGDRTAYQPSSFWRRGWFGRRWRRGGRMNGRGRSQQ
ncbi:DUF5320 domain-containing protein [Candidatus Peribacteria bacterium]|nr:DUF5320 domain-containing protein [Candidatus Peribacteria bacterium]